MKKIWSPIRGQVSPRVGFVQVRERARGHDLVLVETEARLRLGTEERALVPRDDVAIVVRHYVQVEAAEVLPLQ